MKMQGEQIEGNDIIFSKKSAHSGSVCILFMNNLNSKILQIFNDTDGIFIISKVQKKDNHQFVLCNIYAPYTDDPDFFTTVFVHSKFNNEW